MLLATRPPLKIRFAMIPRPTTLEFKSCGLPRPSSRCSEYHAELIGPQLIKNSFPITFSLLHPRNNFSIIVRRHFDFFAGESDYSPSPLPNRRRYVLTINYGRLMTHSGSEGSDVR